MLIYFQCQSFRRLSFRVQCRVQLPTLWKGKLRVRLILSQQDLIYVDLRDSREEESVQMTPRLFCSLESKTVTPNYDAKPRLAV